MESGFISRFTITLHQDCKNAGHTRFPSKSYKNAKTTKFLVQSALYLRKDATAKFYLSTTFGLSFMISSVAPAWSSTFYAYLITKIGNVTLSIVKPLLQKVVFCSRRSVRPSAFPPSELLEGEGRGACVWWIHWCFVITVIKYIFVHTKSDTTTLV